MKKYISAFVIALAALTITSCDKKVDVNAVSAILPPIELSSVGMITPGPYVLPTGTTAYYLQVIFGATTTGKTTGAFDMVIYDSAAATVAVETLHFPSWSSADTFNTTSAGTISYVTVPSEYPNTTIYQGQVLLKYTATTPFVTGHTYNVKLTASTSDYTAATASTTQVVLSQTKLFAIQ